MAQTRVSDREVEPPVGSGDQVVNLGARLREVRLQSGLSLRAVARELGVSPSFVSQLENDRSRPSVATLYSLAQLLNVSMDQLFESTDDCAVTDEPAARPANMKPTDGVKSSRNNGHQTNGHGEPISRSDLGSPAEAWDIEPGARRLSVTKPGSRSRLVMDSGVVWEQLAASVGHGLAFIEVIYPPGSSSTNNDRMLRHAGYECGYLMAGELEVTVGFETTTVSAGDALGFDCSIPHLFRNRGTVPAVGIWCVFDQHP